MTLGIFWWAQKRQTNGRWRVPARTPDLPFVCRFRAALWVHFNKCPEGGLAGHLLKCRNLLQLVGGNRDAVICCRWWCRRWCRGWRRWQRGDVPGGNRDAVIRYRWWCRRWTTLEAFSLMALPPLRCYLRRRICVCCHTLHSLKFTHPRKYMDGPVQLYRAPFNLCLHLMCAHTAKLSDNTSQSDLDNVFIAPLAV
jgi:hypothetical protein